MTTQSDPHDDLTALIRESFPLTYAHSIRCATMQHSCELDDDDDPIYENPDCEERRKAAERRYQQRLDAILAWHTAWVREAQREAWDEGALHTWDWHAYRPQDNPYADPEADA